MFGHSFGLLAFIREQQRLRDAGGEPIKPLFSWLLDRTTGSQLQNSFDYSKNEVTVVDLLQPYLLVSDPKIVQDMMISKNGQIDKTGDYEGLFRNFFGRFFLYTKSDERWKNQRKGLLTAFYKDKLALMLNALKGQLIKASAQWKSEISASKTGAIQLNLSKTTLKIVTDFMMQILVGTNLDAVKLTVETRKSDREPFRPKECCFSEAC
mmetsp:Transcript_39650/g.51963  ORF Transcript_39650/g.51963 Transcript_39650/m.51963 type:complete len:209 (+) Transcript_39650:166-792(+)|eukprot:CAMPEP_0185567780 /NCGR_PEP_ID=MMETSP0434-20130131/935_1 /TAXON_ID=626734 ORGANISM="Favella taraikaensis, Strain Fe Narragansett Bay" /NCGR_SAMPLE_ID=MMETSP0434 /ASSEMBLY_ACC=CAM_ASM_000379 /LENGTH=208 /DNA_ID=CAMNT_0028182085 /DNA_START=166 /DNA_END=792 /DNA_ORIENTATION=+